MKNFIFVQNLIFFQNFDFCQIFRFLSKISIFLSKLSSATDIFIELLFVTRRRFTGSNSGFELRTRTYCIVQFYICPFQNKKYRHFLYTYFFLNLYFFFCAELFPFYFYLAQESLSQMDLIMQHKMCSTQLQVVRIRGHCTVFEHPA